MKNTATDISIPNLPAVLATGFFAVSSPAIAGIVPMSDLAISDAVESKLEWDSGVFANDLDVSVAEGIVTLSGTATSFSAKQRAAMIAKSRKGVRSVINQISVNPPTIPDEKFADSVRKSLTYDPAVRDKSISVAVDGGNVTITGEVDTWALKQLIAQSVGEIAGVTGVTNNIEVRWNSERTDVEINKQIDAAMRHDVWIDDRFISILVDNGVVELSGHVGSVDEKERAVSLAWVAGVSDVTTELLSVNPWATDENRKEESRPEIGDAEVTRAVEDALVYDPRVNSFNPEVDVRSGFVTLRGKVSNLKAKMAAERVAENTVGVSGVRNLLKVRSDEVIADTVIMADILGAFARDPFLETYTLEVGTTNGRVVLEGEVDYFFDKVQAENIASTAIGVKEVTNLIEVNRPDFNYTYYPYLSTYPNYHHNFPSITAGSPTILKPDSAIREAIRSEMAWSWFVDAETVKVEVEDGEATLTGTVEDYAERQAAAKNARDGGAKTVINRLVIDGGNS